jgi:hypothetical protein
VNLGRAINGFGHEVELIGLSGVEGRTFGWLGVDEDIHVRLISVLKSRPLRAQGWAARCFVARTRLDDGQYLGGRSAW